MAHIRSVEAALDAKRFLGDAFFRAQAPDMFCQPAPEVRVDVFAVGFGHGPEVGAT